MEAILEMGEYNRLLNVNGGCLLIIWSYFYAQFSHTDHGAGLLALLSTSLGFTLVGGDDGYPGQLVRFLLRLVVPLRPHLAF